MIKRALGILLLLLVNQTMACTVSFLNEYASNPQEHELYQEILKSTDALEARSLELVSMSDTKAQLHAHITFTQTTLELSLTSDDLTRFTFSEGLHIGLKSLLKKLPTCSTF